MNYQRKIYPSPNYLGDLLLSPSQAHSTWSSLVNMVVKSYDIHLFFFFNSRKIGKPAMQLTKK